MKSLGTPTRKHMEALELDTVLMLVPQDPVTHGDMLVKPSQNYHQQYIKHLRLHIKQNSLNRKLWHYETQAWLWHFFGIFLKRTKRNTSTNVLRLASPQRYNCWKAQAVSCYFQTYKYRDFDRHTSNSHLNKSSRQEDGKTERQPKKARFIHSVCRIIFSVKCLVFVYCGKIPQQLISCMNVAFLQTFPFRFLYKICKHNQKSSLTCISNMSQISCPIMSDILFM